jgi:hypothetical protein
VVIIFRAPLLEQRVKRRRELHDINALLAMQPGTNSWTISGTLDDRNNMHPSVGGRKSSDLVQLEAPAQVPKN